MLIIRADVNKKAGRIRTELTKRWTISSREIRAL